MEINNALTVSGGSQVELHGILQKTLGSMTVAWTQLLSKLAEANANLSALMGKMSNTITKKMNGTFQFKQIEIQLIIARLKGDSDSQRAQDQGKLSQIEAQLSEMQQVDSGASSVAGNISSDASNKVKQATDNADSLVGSTASQIPQMLLATATQLTEQISA